MKHKLQLKRQFSNSFYRVMLRRARYCYDKSSSIHLSMTLRYRDHIGWKSSKIISQLVAWHVRSLQTSQIYSKGNLADRIEDKSLSQQFIMTITVIHFRLTTRVQHPSQLIAYNKDMHIRPFPLHVWIKLDRQDHSKRVFVLPSHRL